MRIFVCELASRCPQSGMPNCVCVPGLSPQLDVQAPLAVNLNWILVTLLKLTSYCQVSLATSDMLLSVWFQPLNVPARVIEAYGLASTGTTPIRQRLVVESEPVISG